MFNKAESGSDAAFGRWAAAGALCGLGGGLVAGALQIAGHDYLGAGLRRSALLALRRDAWIGVPVGIAVVLLARALWLAATSLGRTIAARFGGSARLWRTVAIVGVLIAASLCFLGPPGDEVRAALRRSSTLGWLFGRGRAPLAGLALGLIGALAALSLTDGLPARPLLRGRRTGAALLLVGLGLAALELVFRSAHAPAVGAPNVVLISIDTLRADHLGCYGYERDTSPRIDRLAANGLKFERAYAQASWTLPSMASLHTSLLPHRHGLFETNKRLSNQTTTLAEALREGGYETLAVVSHVFVTAKHGFDQGFASFDQSHVLGHDGVSSEALTQTAIDLLRARSRRPFFLWVHYFDPHFTYVGHAEHDFGGDYGGPLTDHVEFAPLRDDPERLSPEDLQHVVDLYDEEIAFTDRWIGVLLDALDEHAAGESTLIVLTADHGEAFRERGWFGHGKHCYDELTRVPLIISGAVEPSARGRAIRSLAETASIPRTILEACGLDATHFRGASLLDPDNDEALAFIETTHAWSDADRRQAVLRGDWKLIRTQDDDSYELYHLGRDPGERTNLWGRQDDETRAAARELLGHVRALPPLGASRGPHVQIDAGELEHLRQLGYVDD